MDKRTIGSAVIAILVGGAVLFAQATLIGVLASISGPTTPHDITRVGLEWRGLWHSLLFTWSLPAALGALLIAALKPRHWSLYSACAIAPGLILAVEGALGLDQYGSSSGYYLLSNLANLALLPLFLGLYYALIRRHAAA